MKNHVFNVVVMTSKELIDFLKNINKKKKTSIASTRVDVCNRKFPKTFRTKHRVQRRRMNPANPTTARGAFFYT